MRGSSTSRSASPIRFQPMTKSTSVSPGQAMMYQYDAADNLIRKTDAKNQKIEYEYDDAGRLTKTKYFTSAVNYRIIR